MFWFNWEVCISVFQTECWTKNTKTLSLPRPYTKPPWLYTNSRDSVCSRWICLFTKAVFLTMLATCLVLMKLECYDNFPTEESQRSYGKGIFDTRTPGVSCHKLQPAVGIVLHWPYKLKSRLLFLFHFLPTLSLRCNFVLLTSDIHLLWKE